MTHPAGKSAPRWYVRPGVVLPIVGGLVLLTALLTPERVAGRTGDGRLSTFSTEPQGAQLFYDLVQRLGWQVDQRLTAEFAVDPTVIHAVLAPAVPLRMGEVHALLEDVRAGGAVFVVLNDGGNLIGDSLRVTTAQSGYQVRPARAGASPCKPELTFVPLWPDNRAHLNSLRWRGPRPEGIETFLRVDAEQGNGRADAERAAAVGFAYGRGRIVVGSDADFLRNDVIRSCDYGLDVPAIRMLEFLRGGGDMPRRRIVFDEFHQGFGAQPGTLHAIALFLGGTRSGHVLFQILGAGLVLLIAAAPRAIPPRDAGRVERRSPLEHVDALARAYGQVGATRTATTRLVHGVRRRLERGKMQVLAAQADDAFLDRAERTVPALAPDVALIRRALKDRVSRHDFIAAGAALQRLESSLKRT